MVSAQGPRHMAHESLFEASILLIGNDGKDSVAIRDILSKNGFAIRSALSLSAVQSPQDPPPDLIIVDRSAIEMDSVEILDQLEQKKQIQKIPILLVGPADDEILKKGAFKAGVADWANAPVQKFELMAKVKTQLELHRMRNSQGRLERELADAREQAETAIRTKSRFLSHMSHELRTPLNAILGFSRLMERNPNLTATQAENLGLIYQSGEHLLRLINDALEMSRIDTGNETLNPTVIDLSRLLQGVVVMSQRQAADKGLSISLDMAPNIPRFVKCDERRLQQILVNLVTNALKFADEGEIEIDVRRSTEAAPYQKNSQVEPHGPCDLVFEIRDSGPGIPPNELDSIFEPFFKGRHSAGKRGTGLGLTISRKFARMMGGDISAANCRDRGACFTFHACLEPATSEEALSKEKPDRFIGIEPGAKRNRVLVADDDTTSRMLLSEILASVGLDVEKAENGEEAVELFSQWRPDIVFMDVRMPKMDGLAATQRIKATDRGRHTPVIALTAHAFEEDRQEILSAGCDDYLRKPIDEQQLFELVGRILDITFIRENSAPQETPALKGAAALLNAMSELPAPLLTELREIALELDLEKVKSCLDQIETSHPALGAALFKLSNEFRFEEIYNLCDGALKAKV